MSDIETEAILFGRRPTPRDRGLFFIRLALAIVFIAHGWDKFTHLEATIDSFAAVGLPISYVYAVTLLEFLGGVCLLAGVLIRWSGWLLALDMLFAMYLLQLEKGFIGGFELELVLFMAAIGIAMTGPGAYSLSRSYLPDPNP